MTRGKATIRVRQVKSGIGAPAKQKRILEALGLGRMHRTVEHADNPNVRGMVNKIPHLVEIVADNAADA